MMNFRTDMKSKGEAHGADVAAVHVVLWDGIDFQVQTLKEAAERGLNSYLSQPKGAPPALLLVGAFADHVDALGFVALLKAELGSTIGRPFFDDEAAP